MLRARRTVLSHKDRCNYINNAEHSEICTYEEEVRETVFQFNVEIVRKFVLILLHIAHELDRHKNSDQCHRPDQDKQTHQKNIHIQPFCSHNKIPRAMRAEPVGYAYPTNTVAVKNSTIIPRFCQYFFQTFLLFARFVSINEATQIQIKHNSDTNQIQIRPKHHISAMLRHAGMHGEFRCRNYTNFTRQTSHIS